MQYLIDNSLKFNELLNEAKFEHAKDMLRNTVDPITEIAMSLGCSDTVLFTRAFYR